MGSGLYNNSITGMNAAQYGLMTTQHNIANVNTAGFNRQRIQQATNISLMTGSGFLGQGTNVSTVERMYDQFLSGQVNRAQTSVSELESYYSEIAQIDNMLADTNSGLSLAMEEFFSAAQQVAAYPASMSARQSMLSAAQAMIGRYQGLDSRLTELSDGVNGQITGQVDSINSYAQQIAELNDRIIVAQSAVQQPANDLLDQRDQLISELNKLVRVQVIEDSHGEYNVFIGTGQQLVVGNRASVLTAIASADDPTKIVVALKTLGGNSIEMPESLITGGELGGLIRFRNEALTPAFNQLGQVATSMALTFNAQHELGQDLLGQATGEGNFQNDFFTYPQPVAYANSANTGNGVIAATFVPPSVNVTTAGEHYYTNLTTSDYSLGFDGTDYTLTRLSDNFQWGPTDLATLSAAVSASDGFSLALTAGAMNAGDLVMIQPTRAAARNIAVNVNIANDARLLAAAMPVRTEVGMANTGNGQITDTRTVDGYNPAATVLPITLTYDSTTGLLSGFPPVINVFVTAGGVTNVFAGGWIPYNPATGAQIQLNGMAFTLNGTLGNGDTFVLERNASGNADGRNILALGKLQTQKTIAGATASYQETYAQLVSANGNRTRQAEVTGKAQQALLEQATASRDALSGVNMDEEAANLIRYQQAYQASAKMLQVGAKLFDELLAIAG